MDALDIFHVRFHARIEDENDAVHLLGKNGPARFRPIFGDDGVSNPLIHQNMVTWRIPNAAVATHLPFVSAAVPKFHLCVDFSTTNHHFLTFKFHDAHAPVGVRNEVLLTCVQSQKMAPFLLQTNTKIFGHSSTIHANGNGNTFPPLTPVLSLGGSVVGRDGFGRVRQEIGEDGFATSGRSQDEDFGAKHLRHVAGQGGQLGLQMTVGGVGVERRTRLTAPRSRVL